MIPLALLAAFLLAPADDLDPMAVAFAEALAGDWEGALEYRDDSSDQRVKIPTTLEARPAEGGRVASLRFVYDEGKGRFVEGTTLLKVDARAGTLLWESDGGKARTEYTLTGLDAFAADRRGSLVLTGLVAENQVQVEARQAITREGDELTILKETRKPGTDFAFRNAFRLKRQAKPAG